MLRWVDSSLSHPLYDLKYGDETLARIGEVFPHHWRIMVYSILQDEQPDTKDEAMTWVENHLMAEANKLSHLLSRCQEERQGKQ